MLINTFGALAPFLANSVVLLGLVGALVAWAVLSARNLFRAITNVSRHCADATSSLGSRDPASFSASFETAAARLAADALLGPSWRQFRQTLIVPNEPGHVVLMTVPPRSWFELSGLLRKAGADQRYHAALPGLLVGAGLLVTFLGLAAALSSAAAVVAPTISSEMRNAALQTLLGAASVKFITSVTGLFLSIVYTLWRRSGLKRAETALSAFFHALQDCMPLKGQALLQADANAVGEKQYADVQRIGTDFFVNLGATLEREFSAGLAQNIGPLTESMHRLAEKLTTSSEDAMQAMLTTFLTRLEGAVGESTRGTTRTLDALSGRLDGLQGAMDAAALRMGEAAEEMAAGMGRGAQSALGGMTGQIASLVETLRQAADETSRNNREAGDGMAHQMADAARTLTEAVAGFQQGMQEGAAGTVERLADPIERLLGQLQSLAAEQARAGAQSTQDLVGTIAGASAALETTASRIAEILGGGAEDASHRLVAATEAMRDDLRAVLDQFQVTLATSGRAITEGAEAGGGALKAAAAAMGGDLQAGAARLREAAEAAGQALQAGGQQVERGMSAAVGRMVEGSEGLGQRVVAIGQATDTLARQVRDVGDALQSGTAPLAAAASDMRQSAELAQAGLGSWRDTTSALGNSVMSLNGVAGALETTGRGSAELARALLLASERFATIDTGLARTLAELGNGLSGYQDSIGQFVTGMDSGFARSVGGLQAIVKDLENAVVDLCDQRTPPRARAS